MDSVQIKNMIIYHIVEEKLELLCLMGKITKEELQKAKAYVAKKYSLQDELFDSFLS